jgi:hypothetical protein
VQRGLQRPGDHLQRAGGARRAGNEQHEFVRGHARIGRQRQADIVGRKLRCLKQADGSIRIPEPLRPYLRAEVIPAPTAAA